MLKPLLFNRVTAAIAFAVTLGSYSASAGQGPQPSICTRACWGARAPNCTVTQMGGLSRAIVHHTAGSGDYSTNLENSKAVMRNVQNYHMSEWLVRHRVSLPRRCCRQPFRRSLGSHEQFAPWHT